MIDYASKHLDPALTPQILLKSANLIKEIVWVSIQLHYLIYECFFFVLLAQAFDLLPAKCYTVSKTKTSIMETCLVVVQK